MSESPIRLDRLLKAQSLERELSEEFGEDIPLGLALVLSDLREDIDSIRRRVNRVENTVIAIIAAALVVSIVKLAVAYLP